MTITALKTESMTTPLGLDTAAPAFSWILNSSRPKASQSAYQLIVSASLSLDAPVWNSGKIFSDHSANICYAGARLLPCTRYYWQVTVWDEQNQSSISNISWFETGLMGKDASVWRNAQWIGAPFQTTNTAALTTYELTVDVLTESGNTAGIVLAARNKDNFVLFDFDMEHRLLRVLEFNDNAWDGSFQDGNIPTTVTLGNPNGYAISTKAILPGREHKWNRISIRVIDREVTVTINKHAVIDHEANLMPLADFFVPRRSCLSSIGFRQLGSRAEYDNLIIANPITGDIYQQETFSDETGCLSILGECQNNRLVVENRFELACPVPAVNLLRGFHSESKIVKARLYASARGFYGIQINGKKINQDYFHPGFTDYRLRIPYQTFDITPFVKTGLNRILVTVAKGYYSGYCGYSGPMKYGEQNSFLARLDVTFEDGSCQTLVTDGDWKFTDRGPILDSDYLDGENYDARLEPTDWYCEDYADQRWKSCGILPWPQYATPTNGTFSRPVPFELTAQEGPTAQVERILTPISMTENPIGHYVYDFGQNMVGTIRLCVKGERGLSLKIRYGEMSYANGEIYIKNIRSAANTDTYTLKGDPEGETFIPTYTSHGFRYVEITGNGHLLLDSDCILSLEGLVLCNTPEVIGDFSCSDPLINKLQNNIQWGQRGNSLLVFTDCPQRNERMGWTGDAQVFAATAAYNMDIKAFMRKWLLDVRDGQLMYNKQGAVPDTAPLGGDNRPAGCAGWADAAIIVPWEMYTATGDIQILKDNYRCMQNWVSYQSLPSRQNYGLRTVNGKAVPNASDLASIPLIQVQQSRGDHLTFDESTPFILTATAYAAYAANLLSRIAKILGKPEDAAIYEARFKMIRQAFREAWVQPDGSLAYWGEMSKSGKDINGAIINQTRYSNTSSHHPSQTAYALAIDFDLMPEETMAHTAECFIQSIKDRNEHLSVGFLGISHLLPALTKIGETELAYRLMEQKGNPGWLYSVINGATTIWERWNSYIAETGTFGDVSMNSFNHYAYGAIGQWMYQTILGIRSGEKADEAGYKRIYLAPHWGGTLSFAKGWHQSPYGRIESSWERKDGQLVYHCTIPANTTAKLSLPLGEMKVSEPSSEAKFISCENGCAFYELLPGSYRFTLS